MPHSVGRLQPVQGRRIDRSDIIATGLVNHNRRNPQGLGNRIGKNIISKDYFSGGGSFCSNNPITGKCGTGTKHVRCSCCCSPAAKRTYQYKCQNTKNEALFFHHVLTPYRINHQFNAVYINFSPYRINHNSITPRRGYRFLIKSNIINFALAWIFFHRITLYLKALRVYKSIVLILINTYTDKPLLLVGNKNANEDT